MLRDKGVPNPTTSSGRAFGGMGFIDPRDPRSNKDTKDLYHTESDVSENENSVVEVSESESESREADTELQAVQKEQTLGARIIIKEKSGDTYPELAPNTYVLTIRPKGNLNRIGDEEPTKLHWCDENFGKDGIEEPLEIDIDTVPGLSALLPKKNKLTKMRKAIREYHATNVRHAESMNEFKATFKFKKYEVNGENEIKAITDKASQNSYSLIDVDTIEDLGQGIRSHSHSWKLLWRSSTGKISDIPLCDVSDLEALLNVNGVTDEEEIKKIRKAVKSYHKKRPTIEIPAFTFEAISASSVSKVASELTPNSLRLIEINNDDLHEWKLVWTNSAGESHDIPIEKVTNLEEFLKTPNGFKNLEDLPKVLMAQIKFECTVYWAKTYNPYVYHIAYALACISLLFEGAYAYFTGVSTSDSGVILGIESGRFFEYAFNGTALEYLKYIVKFPAGVVTALDLCANLSMFGAQDEALVLSQSMPDGFWSAVWDKIKNNLDMNGLLTVHIPTLVALVSFAFGGWSDVAEILDDLLAGIGTAATVTFVAFVLIVSMFYYMTMDGKKALVGFDKALGRNGAHLEPPQPTLFSEFINNRHDWAATARSAQTGFLTMLALAIRTIGFAYLGGDSFRQIAKLINPAISAEMLATVEASGKFIAGFSTGITAGLARNPAVYEVHYGNADRPLYLASKEQRDLAYEIKYGDRQDMSWGAYFWDGFVRSCSPVAAAQGLLFSVPVLKLTADLIIPQLDALAGWPIKYALPTALGLIAGLIPYAIHYSATLTKEMSELVVDGKKLMFNELARQEDILTIVSQLLAKARNQSLDDLLDSPEGMSIITKLAQYAHDYIESSPKLIEQPVSEADGFTVKLFKAVHARMSAAAYDKDISDVDKMRAMQRETKAVLSLHLHSLKVAQAMNPAHNRYYEEWNRSAEEAIKLYFFEREENGLSNLALLKVLREVHPNLKLTDAKAIEKAVEMAIFYDKHNPTPLAGAAKEFIDKVLPKAMKIILKNPAVEKDSNFVMWIAAILAGGSWTARGIANIKFTDNVLGDLMSQENKFIFAVLAGLMTSIGGYYFFMTFIPETLTKHGKTLSEFKASFWNKKEGSALGNEEELLDVNSSPKEKVALIPVAAPSDQGCLARVKGFFSCPEESAPTHKAANGALLRGVRVDDSTANDNGLQLPFSRNFGAKKGKS